MEIDEDILISTIPSVQFVQTFIYNDLKLKCEIKNNKQNWYFKGLQILKKKQKFKQLACLDLSLNNASKISIYNSNINAYNQNFYLLASETTKLTYLSSIDLTKTPRLANDLYKVLFSNDQNDQCPVLLTVISETLLHGFRISNCDEKIAENSSLILNTSSAIVHIDSFNFKDPLDGLLTSSKKSSTNLCNCLIIVTKNGKIYSYSYLSAYAFKISTLPNFVNTCLKYNKEFLYYCTTDGEIYNLNLKNLFDKQLKATFVRKLCAVRFMIDASNNLIAETPSGDLVKIVDASVDLNALKIETNKRQNNVTKEILKSSLESLSRFSNQIVNKQISIDSLSAALRQIYKFKTLELNPQHKYDKSDHFEIQASIKSIEAKSYFQINIRNKNTKLDKSIKDSDTSKSEPIKVTVCIQLHDLGIKTLWWNRSLPFSAYKPNDEQIILMDFDNFQAKLLKPHTIFVYLTYNLNEYLVNYDKNLDSKPSEFSICIYRSKFELCDNFLRNPKTFTLPQSYHLPNSIYYNIIKNVYPNNNKLLNNWTKIKIENIKKDILSVSNFEFLAKGKYEKLNFIIL